MKIQKQIHPARAFVFVLVVREVNKRQKQEKYTLVVFAFAVWFVQCSFGWFCFYITFT